MFDSHVHTKFSTDSEMKITDAIETANKLQLGLIITEHMDLGFPTVGNNTFNIDAFFREYSKYRSDKTLLGIELGMRPDLLEKVREVAAYYPFDQIIGSVHVVDKMDAYKSNFYEGRTKNQVYEQYLKYMVTCIKTHDFIDTLGHIDYITRYNNFFDKELYYDEYIDYIDEILMLLAQREKAIEINTNRLNSHDSVINLTKIYKRFKELGGRFVTIGSDAHTPDRIGSNFNKAKNIADSCGLQIVYFKKRKAVPVL